MSFGVDRGPGKYDAEAERVMRRTAAKGGVVVIVFGGKKGNGASIKVATSFQKMLPDLLRQLAADLERAAQN